MSSIRPLKFVIALIGGTWNERYAATAHIERQYPGEVMSDSYFAHQANELSSMLEGPDPDFTQEDTDPNLTVGRIRRDALREGLRDILGVDDHRPISPRDLVRAYAYDMTEAHMSANYWTAQVAAQAAASVGPESGYNPAPPRPDKRPRVYVIHDIERLYHLQDLRQALAPDTPVVALRAGPSGNEDLDKQAKADALEADYLELVPQWAAQALEQPEHHEE